MATRDVLLELIDDNPYNPRKHYPRDKVNSMAHSLVEMGQLEIPRAREVDGRVQLASGNLRKRALDKLHKQDPNRYGAMTLDILPISDEDMFYYSLEENLQRTDITPLEIARSIDSFLTIFPDKTEEEVARKFKMAQPSVANMRRVLRLPEKILRKIDDETISFTQGRELLIFERFENGENLMGAALDGLNIGNKLFGEPNTVEGLQRSIHRVIKGQCRPLDKGKYGGYDLIFDTRTIGCLQCDKMVRTHPTKSETTHYCTDAECWDSHQQDQKEIASAEAKAKMEANVLQLAAQEIAKPPAERIIHVDEEKFAEINASYSGDRISEGQPMRKPFKWEGELYISTGGSSTKSGGWNAEAYQLVPRTEFTIAQVRTYKVPADRESEEYYESLRNDPNGFYHGMLVQRGKVEHVLVGPKVTFVTKVDEGDLSQKIPASCQDCPTVNDCIDSAVWQTYKGNPACPNRGIKPADSDKKLKRKPIPVVTNESGIAIAVPCESCASADSCDLTYFHVATDGSGQIVCEKKIKQVPEEVKAEQFLEEVKREAEVVEGLVEEELALARTKAGTRAEVLDLKDIGGSYNQEVTQGYALLDGVGHPLEQIVDPEECLERCTHGFHYAFDSRQREPRTSYVCSDTKCLTQKKAAFTRAKNAEGQARKKAEMKAVKQAIAQTTTLDRPRIKLILLAQVKGAHTQRSYFYGQEMKLTETWLWDKVSAGTPQNDRNIKSLFKKIDKLTNEELAKLVVEFMFYYLVDHGDIGSYEIKASEPLNWMGIKVETKELNDGQS